MGELEQISVRLFAGIVDNIAFFFPDLRGDMRMAGMKGSMQEYLAKSLFISMLSFVFLLPFLSFFLSFVFETFLFGFMTSVTFSIAGSVLAFVFAINYPKSVISQKKSEIDRALPFLTLNLASIAGSRLQLADIFRIFYKFSGTGETGRQMKQIIDDVDLLGMDINTALERATERSPSKNLKEILWGLLSISRTGGDMVTFLKEVSTNLMNDYRRKLSEFSHQLTLYIEIYLTMVFLGAIFFTILTSIISGLGGGAQNVVAIQAFLIFIFIPLISTAFIFLIKTLMPSEG